MTTPPSRHPTPTPLQSHIWRSTIPLHITHPSSPHKDPYLVLFPRLSYLPLLIPQLISFFRVPPEQATTFSFEGIVLRNLPVGLLWDLYVGAAKDGGGEDGDEGDEGDEGEEEGGQGGDRGIEGNGGRGKGRGKGEDDGVPWKLVLGEGVGWDIRDTFVNSVKEADFLRNGTARGIMSLSKEDSDQLWNAVKDCDLQSYLPIQTKLLSSAQPLRHIPFRLYIPSPPDPSSSSSVSTTTTTTTSPPNLPNPPSTSVSTTTSSLGSYKVIQALLPPRISISSSSTSRTEPQTLGTALNSLLPALFPSRRDPLFAEVWLHGAPVPFRAPLEEVMWEGAFADGWVGGVVVMLR